MILVVAVVLVAATATVAFAALSSGPTGGCLNPLATHYLNQQNSMGPTLVPGDLVLTAPPSAGAPFTRGEIVVFSPPAAAGAAGGSLFIKRIVGLPGETVSLADGVVVINGTPLAEPYLAPGTTTVAEINSWTIGADEVFVLGDTRGSSFDSRQFGPIPAASVTGHATAICSPDNRKTALP